MHQEEHGPHDAWYQQQIANRFRDDIGTHGGDTEQERPEQYGKERDKQQYDTYEWWEKALSRVLRDRGESFLSKA